MHMYQKHIIDLLRRSDEQHYASLQPEGVESSHFKYHLNQLIKDGYVEQKSRGVYTLSAAGLAFVDTLSDASVIAETGPKVITYSLIQNEKFYYFQTKQKDPYRGLTNMVGGKVHFGETTARSATREVKEKVGLEGVRPTRLGVAEILISSDTSLISHVIAYVYVFKVGTDYSNPTLTQVEKDKVAQIKKPAPDLLSVIEATTKPEFTIALDLTM